MGEPTFQKRLQDVIRALGIEHQEFARLGGISKATLSGYVQTGRQPKVDTLRLWVENCNINANWLLAGIGPMFLDDMQERELTPLGKELADLQQAMEKIDASNVEIRQAIMAHLGSGKSTSFEPPEPDDAA